MIYLLGLAVNYLCLFFSNTPVRRKFLTVLTLLTLGAIVVLRGRVGTDTGLTYEPMVQNLQDHQGTEPLFIALLYLVKSLFPTALTAVTIGLGVTLTALLLVYAWRAGEDELFLLQAFFVPAQYLGISISGQRAGLSVALLLLAWQSFARQKGRQAAVLMVLALLTHYSAALFILMWWLNAAGVKRRINWVLLAPALGLFAVGLFAAKDYLLMKFVLYFQSSYERPSPWSGVSTILLCLFVLMAAQMARLPQEDTRRLWSANTVAIAFAVLIGLYSYSALRLLGIIETSLVYGLLNLCQKRALPFSVNLRRSLVCIGLLAAMFTTRYVLQETADPVSTSPALPYRFLWQETAS